MPYRWLPETVATLYAELLDQAIQAEAAGAAGTVPTGSFISKTIGGRTYWYLQRSEGHRKRQVYLGPDSPSLRRWMDRVRHDRRDAAPDRENRRRLCAMLASGGAATEPAAVVKVLQLLSESGIFRLGGVLVGTLAFRTYANVLGVRFERGATRTEDIDIAHDPVIGIALAREDAPTDLEQTLTGAGMGFPPIPVFHHGEPSTSFKIRGRDLRVDLLTPMRGRESSAPVHLHAYRVSAQPVRFLEYLLHDTIDAVVLGSSPVLVTIPDPARFTLHKLWTSRKRTAGFHTKARKDLLQAAQLAEILLDTRPTALQSAWTAIDDPSTRHTILQAATHLDPGLHDRLVEVIGA